jgi:hypothetical protein
MQTNRCKRQVYGQRMFDKMYVSPSIAAAWQPERQAVPCIDVVADSRHGRSGEYCTTDIAKQP